MRQRLAEAWITLSILRLNTLRSLKGVEGEPSHPPEASISKLFWSTWHRDLGELAMDVIGMAGTVAPSPALRAVGAPEDLPLQPGRHDLRRIERDPAEHRRRAGARPPARAEGITLSRRPGRHLDRSPTAGGPRAARAEGRRRHGGGRHRDRLRHSRALHARGGRTVVDLGRPRAAPRGDGGPSGRDLGDPATGGRLRRDRRGGRPEPLRAGRLRARPDRRRRQQRRPRRHGRDRGDDRRAVVVGPRHHPDRNVPLHPSGADATCTARVTA